MIKKLISLIMLTVLFNSAYADTTCADTMRTITVSGKAKDKAIVDTIKWNINLSATDWDADDCKKDIDKEAEKLISTLTKIYGSEQKYESSTYNNYVSGRKNYCKQKLSFTTNKLELYEKTTNEITALGDISVDVTTISSTIKETEKLVLIKALGFAIEKADVLAKQINMKLGEVIEIKENIKEYNYRPSMQRMEVSGFNRGNVTLDPIEIQAEIIYKVEIKK